jgi:hypothetical protein
MLNTVKGWLQRKPEGGVVLEIDLSKPKQNLLAMVMDHPEVDMTDSILNVGYEGSAFFPGRLFTVKHMLGKSVIEVALRDKHLRTKVGAYLVINKETGFLQVRPNDPKFDLKGTLKIRVFMGNHNRRAA